MSKSMQILSIGLMMIVLIMVLKFFGMSPMYQGEKTIPGEMYAGEDPNKAVPLEIIMPYDGVQIQNTQVSIVGKTLPNALISIGAVNLTADAAGNFNAIIHVLPGDNKLTIVSYDGKGNTAEKKLTVKVL